MSVSKLCRIEIHVGRLVERYSSFALSRGTIGARKVDFVALFSHFHEFDVVMDHLKAPHLADGEL